MNLLQSKIQQVEDSRKAFIAAAKGLSLAQSEFKPNPDSWSIKQVVEHMVWAERAGVVGMWKVLEGVKNGQALWEGENENQGLGIEAVIENTWQTREQVPTIAEPLWGGALDFWISSLEACAYTLKQLGEALEGMDLEQIIYPHPISGPLNIIQRIDFLSFHLKRHQGQIERIKADPNFPK